MAASGVAAAGQAQPLDDLLGRLRDLEEDAVRRPLLEGALRQHSPDALATALKAEAERLWQVDPHASVRVSEAIALCGELAARPELVALGVMAKGDALRLLGRYPESLALLDEAGERFLALGDEVGWARTRIGRVVSAHRLGRGGEALLDVERARAVLVRHGEWLRAGGLDLNTAVVYLELGRYRQALALYDRAQRAYESLGAAGARRAAWVQANRAVTHALLGDLRAALAAPRGRPDPLRPPRRAGGRPAPGPEHRPRLRRPGGLHPRPAPAGRVHRRRRARRAGGGRHRRAP